MDVSEAGRKGAFALNAKLTAKQRSNSASRASKARWKKHKEQLKAKS